MTPPTKLKALITSDAVSKGGRSGTISDPDGLLSITLGNPLQTGLARRGPNPELLFAAAYSACYHGALLNAAGKLSITVKASTVRARVRLLEDQAGAYHLGIELHAKLPGVSRTDAEAVMKEAHQTCPYSKALRGDAEVTLVVD